MKTDGGWVSISEASRLYGRHRKWVSDQIERYNIETRKRGNQKQLRLTELIRHRGEPQGDATASNENHTENPQIIAPSLPYETALLKQECHFLREQVEELKADRTKWETREARWDAERARLEGIIERQTAVLPAPERSGWFARLVGWTRNT